MKKTTLKEYRNLTKKYDQTELTNLDINNINKFIDKSVEYLNIFKKHRECFVSNKNSKNLDKLIKKNIEDIGVFEFNLNLFDRHFRFYFNSEHCFVDNLVVYSYEKQLKESLKEIQLIIYVKSFDKHMDLIDRLDSLIKNKVNHNDQLFSYDFYSKNIECYSHIKKEGKKRMTSEEKEALNEYRLKRNKPKQL